MARPKRMGPIIQYGATVPGASFVSTEYTNAFGVGINSDGRRILEMVKIMVYRNDWTR